MFDPRNVGKLEPDEYRNILRKLAVGGEYNWRRRINKSEEDEKDELTNPISELYTSKMLELFNKYKIIEPDQSDKC